MSTSLIIAQVFTDIHVGATNELKGNALVEIVENFLRSDIERKNMIYLGDNIDLANCKKQDVEKYRALLNKAQSLFRERFVEGNHERIGLKNQFYQQLNTLFIHGDLTSNFERWAEYRSKPHGASFFKRGIVVNAIEAAEKIINRKPKEEFLKNTWALAKINNCKRVYCGHFHPDERITTIYKDVEIIILPRGRHDVEVI